MEEQFEIRLDKLEKIKNTGCEIYPFSFDKTHSLSGLHQEYGEKSADQLEGEKKDFKVAGRILSIRKMGKSSFCHIFDGDSKLQIYIQKGGLPEEEFTVFKLLDIGDVIGCSGKILKTRTGELTLLVSRLKFLTKSFHPLPEKWHGLQDKELRFRQRYLDLIVNERTRKIFNMRSLMIQSIRMFFYEHGYREVETPMMQPIPGGACARPFKTHHNALNIDLYLRIAPELYLKRLLVGGMEKIFEINRNFRNEGISQMHNPEFTMIEFYELYRDFNYYMEFTEKLLDRLNREFLEDDTIEYLGQKISMKIPFKRLRYVDAIAENSGLTVEEIWNEEKLKTFIKNKLAPEEMPPTYGKMLELMFDEYVEKTLIEPVFVTHFPLAISPLSKWSREDPRETERFELFVSGMEIANGFSELNDPREQKRRFESQLIDKEKGDAEAQNMDNDFIRALEHGMPPAAGEGVGIDRLIMLYTGAESIKEVILFPLLKPKDEI